MGELNRFQRAGSTPSERQQMNIKSQEAKIRTWLESGRAINPLTALKRFHSFRLGARVYSLRKQSLNITTTMIQKDGSRFASYALEK